MRKQKRLLLARNIFLVFIFVAFGIIIVTEKSAGMLIPKVEKKMTEYLESNYSDILTDVKMGKVIYDKASYQTKVTSKENKNHFFYLNYAERKMTDTYKKDYYEGNQLFSSIEKNLEDEIRDKISTSVKVEIISTLDKYTTRVQERIIKEDDLIELKFYTIEKELMIKDWNSEEITDSINEFIKRCQDNEITPKNYKIIITNKNDVTESIEIRNLDEEFITNPDKEKLIDDILNDNTSKLLKDSKIKYKYLN